MKQPSILVYDKLTKFEDILEQEDLLQLFTAHLAKELSVENILFYTQVNQMKNQDDDSKRHKLAQEILNKYIVPYSVCEINLEYKLRSKAMDDFSKGNISGIIEAQEYIVDLLKQDSYPRFSRSNELKKWVAYRLAIQQKMAI